MAAPREEDLEEAVNILRRSFIFFSYCGVCQIRFYTAFPVLHVALANVESTMAKKLHSKTIYKISPGRAEYGKVKKAHPKPFPQDYNAIPMKHRREQLDATLKLANLCRGLSKPCAFL